MKTSAVTRARWATVVPAFGGLLVLMLVPLLYSSAAYAAPSPVEMLVEHSSVAVPGDPGTHRGRTFVYRQNIVVPHRHRAWGPGARQYRGRQFEIETQFRVRQRRRHGRTLRLDIYIEAIRVYRGRRIVLEATRLPRSMRTVKAHLRPHRSVVFRPVLTIRPAPHGAYLVQSAPPRRRFGGRTQAVVHVDGRTGRIRPVRHRLHGLAADIRVALLPTQARWWQSALHDELQGSRSPRSWHRHRSPGAPRWPPGAPPTGRHGTSPRDLQERAAPPLETTRNGRSETTGGT